MSNARLKRHRLARLFKPNSPYYNAEAAEVARRLLARDATLKLSAIEVRVRAPLSIFARLRLWFYSMLGAKPRTWADKKRLERAAAAQYRMEQRQAIKPFTPRATLVKAIRR